MNLEDIVLNNIRSLILTTKIDCYDEETNLKIGIKYEENSKNNDKIFKIYASKLSIKYNFDDKQIIMHIINQFIKKNKIKELTENYLVEKEANILSLSLELENNKFVELNLPISHKDEETNYLIEELLEEINYDLLKKNYIKSIEKKLEKEYNANNISDLIIFPSKMRTGSTIIKTKKKNSMYCFTNGLSAHDKKDIVVSIAKDFLDKNKNEIDSYTFNNNKVKISFKNGKTFETTNEDLINSLKDTLNSSQNILIDNKIKELKINKEK